MRSRLGPLAGVIAVSALTLGGCGGGGGYGNGPASQSPEPQGAAPPAGTTARVTMENIAFKPDRLTARVGQTVHWTNQDGVPHTVTATKGASFASKVLEPSQSYSYKVAATGTVSYVCTIHANMKGTIQAVK
jgi:plastocyanin